MLSSCRRGVCGTCETDGARRAARTTATPCSTTTSATPPTACTSACPAPSPTDSSSTSDPARETCRDRHPGRRRRPAHQRRRPVQPRGARGPAAHARGPARRGPGRVPVAVRRLRPGPLRAGARRARRLAGVPVRGRRRAVELPQGEAVAAAEPAAGGRPAPARRPAARAAEGAQPAVAAAAARTAGSPTPRRWSTRCWPTGTEFDGKRRLAEAFPLRVFPDAVGLGPDGRENLLPYGDHAFNAFGPSQRPGRQGRAARGGAVGLGRRPVPARRARPGGVRRGHLGGRRTAGTSRPSRRR